MKRIFEAIALAAWGKIAGVNPDTRFYEYQMEWTAYVDVAIKGTLHQELSVTDEPIPGIARIEPITLEPVLSYIYLGYGPLTNTLIIGQIIE